VLAGIINSANEIGPNSEWVVIMAAIETGPCLDLVIIKGTYPHYCPL